MTSIDAARVRSIDAAERLLATKAAGSWWNPASWWPKPLAEAAHDWLLLPWLLGRAGRSIPVLSDPAATVRAQLLARIGSNDAAAVMQFLDEQRATRILGSREASLYGDVDLVELLIDDAAARSRLPADSDGRMLARTGRPDRLLDLVEGWQHEQALAVMGEIVIRGRDAGVPHARAEAMWHAIVPSLDHYRAHTRMASDAAVRLAGRADMPLALQMLERAHRKPYRAFVDGPEAVLARLVVADAARAVEYVSTRPLVQLRLAWSRHLLRSGAMPAPAVGFFDVMLARGDRHVDLALAGIFAALDEPGWLDRAWPGAARTRPHAIAVTFAHPMRRLRDRGEHDRAESLRDRVAPVIRAGAPERALDPIDVLDAFSAPGVPTCTPFGHGMP